MNPNGRNTMTIKNTPGNPSAELYRSRREAEGEPLPERDERPVRLVLLLTNAAVWLYAFAGLAS